MSSRIISLVCWGFVFAALAAPVDLSSRIVDGVATFDEILPDGDYAYSGDTRIDLVFDLAANAKFAGSLSGNFRLVKRGAGVLEITTENTYAGGTKIERGVVAITKPGALGAGDVEVVASASSSAVSCLRLDQAMTFANNINVTGGMSGTGASSISVDNFKLRRAINIKTENDTTLSGNITASCDLYLWDDESNKTRTISGKVTADGHNILVGPNKSTFVFSGGIKAKIFHATYLYLHMGKVLFTGAPVDIEKLTVDYSKVELYNVFGEHACLHQKGSKEAVRTIAYLKEDVTVAGWTTEKADNSGVLIYSIQPSPQNEERTFTIRASADGTSYGSLYDKVNLVYDPVDPACTQVLTSQSQRTHPTSGEIVVKGGTFKVEGFVSLPYLKAIRVAAGAKFVADTKGTASFKGLEEIEVGAGAVFSCAGETTDPFSFTQTKLKVAEGATLTLPADETFTVTELWYNGQRLGMGTYTPDGANGTQALPGLTSGTIDVPFAHVETVTSSWTGAADEDAGKAANWAGGIAPNLEDFSAELVFASQESASTRAVVSGMANVRHIVFRQPLGFTLSSTPQGGITLLDGLSFADIGEAAPRYTLDAPVTILTDQTWLLPSREDSVFAITKPICSDQNSVASLYVTNNLGTLNFCATNSTFTGNLYAQAKTMNISGENVFGPCGTDGNVTLKFNHHNNTAKCYFRGCSINKPLKCEMAVNGVNYEIFDCVEGATNIFNGNVVMPDWTAFRKGSVTYFNGGAVFNNYTRTTVYSGATLVFRTKLKLAGSGATRCFDPRWGGSSTDVHARYVFECPIEIDNPNNYAFNCRNGTEFDFRYEYALKNGIFYSQENGRILLNGFSQRAQGLRYAINNNPAYGVVSSTNAPAFLELNNTSGQCETNAIVFTDLAGFRMVGAGFVRLNGISTTSGTLAVENGIVEMGDATWCNASNVVVSGTGTLKVTKNGVFDARKAALALSGEGQIEVDAGVTAWFLSAQVETAQGVARVPTGMYKAHSAGALSGRIRGEGTVAVVGYGFQIMIR